MVTEPLKYHLQEWVNHLVNLETWYFEKNCESKQFDSQNVRELWGYFSPVNTPPKFLVKIYHPNSLGAIAINGFNNSQNAVRILGITYLC